ncbi:MAG: hypothetical protein KJO38_03955, partial [Gammaproteobacteria bacterium]|nr:hypothetical protein [Gammaproteobacteria bacterium]
MMLSASPGSLAAPAWRDISAAESAAGPGTPGPARHIAIDRVGVRSRLNAARLQGSGYIELPAPVGSRYFRITETPVLAPALARRHPGIRTYTGVDISEPATTLKLALTPAGFTAQVMGPEGSYYVDPVRGHADRHILYTRRDRGRKSMPPPRCAVEGHAASAPAGSALPRGRATNEAAQAAAASALASGAVLSEYRLAVAATGQYTAYHGGTVAGALAAIATAVNRVNGIFERDVAVRFTLIEENEQIIYTDAATDPYSGGSASALAEQNQNNLDAVLPPTAYDIGQVFSTNNTGFAFFGVACRLTLKARGASGATAPDSDSFYVDIVAHELAHQLDARHTFNGTAGQCGANRSANDAYEPGSGSTIMAYAGICNGDNLKLRTDDYFHTHSFE